MIVLFFGKLGETVGRDVLIEAPPEGLTVAEIRELLGQLNPHASADLRKPSLRACVDDAFVGEQFLVDPAAELAFFPPLSGG